MTMRVAGFPELGAADKISCSWLRMSCMASEPRISMVSLPTSD
eukprot:CAMPEP_0174708720 /NCGR_PEP_ID=MMETSP1094-20130205/10894_1 /TAXON_ID=156173 /ORGANISM="Chrysochromulina brevifilum, Strain UTEX LB 985" /LENGTH=42 /DNA_ID= /DNA_START= /DNA_END= /DNA_ORIENTATION=